MPLARLLWLLLLLGVSVPAIPAALVADDAALLSPYPWSWRKIISAVERRAALGLLEPRSAEAAADSYQLIDNLPTVEKKSSNTTRLLLQPERCDNCTPGTKPQPAGAGRVNSLVHKFTDSKSRALPGQFPWHVSLLYREWFYSCSGSLVSDEWIITAANCVHGFDSIKVRLGSFRPGLKDERFRTTMTCSHIVVHPGYRKGSPKDDIAVLRLSGLVRMNGYILPVRLPSLNSFSTSYTGRKAWLSGWGVTSSLGKLSSSASLGYVQEEVLPNERCTDTFGEISSSVLCTSTSRFTSDNQGDSGAPLVVDEGGFFVQIGVLSFAPSAGFARGGAAGFTRVTSYLRWIQNVTAIAPGSDINVVE